MNRNLRSVVFDYLKTAVVLLMITFPLGFIINCGLSDFTGEEEDVLQALSFLFWFSKSEVLETADSRLEIGMALIQVEENSAQMLQWSPPEGASSFQFEGLSPSNPAGPPPFLFENPPVHAQAPSEPDLRVSYLPPAASGRQRLVDTFLVTAASGAEQAFNVSHDETGKFFESGDGQVSGRTLQDGGGISWRWANWLYTDAFDLEESQAEALVDYLQSGEFFIGLRFPVQQETSPLDYEAPVVMKPDEMPHIAILDHTMPWGGNDLSQAVADLELEYDPGHLEFLENSLPVEEGTRWTSMRPKSDPIQIEDRFPLASGDWELFTTGVIDLSEMEDSCRDCVLEVYFCHEGAEEPGLFDLLATKRMKSYQGEGITCFGPVPKRLFDAGGSGSADPSFSLTSVPLLKVEPSSRVSFYVEINPLGGASVNLDFNLQSSAGLSWKLYEGSWEEPNLSRPINGAYHVDSAVTIWVVGDLPADAQGLETVRLTASDASDASKSTWTATSMWIGDWIPPETEAWAAWIPVASHAAGAQGSAWRTDLGLLNPGSAAAVAEISLLSGGNSTSMQQSIPAGSQLILNDVVDQLGISGAGSLKITARGALIMTSRTYSQVGPTADCYPSGTLGQSLASSDDSPVLTAGSSALIPQLVENGAYRTNIAVTNTGNNEAQVRVHLHDAGGAELTSYDVSLDPGQWKQENQPFKKKAGLTNMSAGYAEIEVLSGAGIVGYGSVVDNITNDPTTIAPVLASAADASTWIPVASHAGGANGSAWRTDLGLLNPASTSTEVEVRFHGSGGGMSFTQEILAHAQVILIDVLDQMGISGAGALEMAADSGLIVSSRTYSQVGSSAQCYPSGTLGQSLASTAQSGSLSAGQTATIPQLTENSAYRTNIAVTNTGESHADVRVHLFDAGGTEVTSYDVSLDPGQWKQENQPFLKKAGLSDMEAGYAIVEIISGSGISGYGSVVDNTTNDPTTMPMIR